MAEYDDFNDEDGTRFDYDDDAGLKTDALGAYMAAEFFHQAVHAFEQYGDDIEDTIFFQLTLSDLCLVHAAVTMAQLANPCIAEISDEFLLKLNNALKAQEKEKPWEQRLKDLMIVDGGEG